ncbi:MAG: YbjQ family protein [Tepidiformaceae bacterium]
MSFPQYTTTPAGDYDTLGIVAGTAVMGANIFRDMFAAVTDVVGGRSGKYQSVVDRGREIALTEMCDEAQRRGAELVGGIRIDIEAMDNMFVISATGTALKARVQSVPRAAVHHRPSPAV